MNLFWSVTLIDLKGETRRVFLRNFAVLCGLMLLLFIIMPDMMKQIFSLYNGLGILPIFIIMLIISAMPKRKRGR